MKKLNILKYIIDFMLIMFSIGLLIAIILSVLFILDSEMLTTSSNSLFNGLKGRGFIEKISLSIDLANSILIFYILFNFKLLLEKFIDKLIFETETCLLLNRIGKLLIYSSVIDIVSESILKLSTNKIGFSFSGFLYILSTGLFFLVLAEVFKMGKQLKEENDLMI